MTEDVRFGRGEHGAVTVIVPEEYEPLDQLLRSDVRDDRTMLADILDHARDPVEDEWGTGGNSCWISITAAHVTVENEYSGQTATLSREKFIEIAEAYGRELDAAAAEKRQ